MPVAENARRAIPKATYVPLVLPAPRQQPGRAFEGNAVEKYRYVRDLALANGEVDRVLRESSAVNTTGLPSAAEHVEMLRAFEGTPMPAQLPSHATFNAVPTTSLLAFGRAVASARQQQLDATSVAARPVAAGANTDRPMQVESLAISGTVALQKSALNAGLIANKTFESSITATPIGMLNLEKLEMTPAGVERGELIATICLAPREETSVIQKEWSVTSQEYTSIVTDSLENYSETGVTENTELAQSTTAQVQHSNQFNINATVSGSYGFVSATVSTAFSSQDANSQSATESRKHAIATTQKASSRVKQSHKTTIVTSTVTGSAETTTRTLVNPSDIDPMRIDYFSIMRKWRVRLYRYGLRMTYDIGIPEPGATLREAYAKIDDLTQKIGVAFTFGLNPWDITPDNVAQHALTYQASVPEPPQPAITQRLGGPVSGLGKLGDDEGWHFQQVTFQVPDGFEITGALLDALIGNVDNDPVSRNFLVFGYGPPAGLGTNGKAAFVEDMLAANGFMKGATASQQIVYFLQNVDAAAVTFVMTYTPMRQTMSQWQMTVWQALHDAARDAFYAQQQSLVQQRDAIAAKLDADTLTLRREESDEIMKGVLRWLLGTGFEFMPADVQAVFKAAGGDLEHGVAFTGNDLGVSPTAWTTMYQYQEMIKFINEAIEWENTLYFLYPYFWDVPPAWDFVRTIQHPDSTRQSFLRAGSARVVLTVRKGYEQSWLAFVQLGDLSATLPPDHPYMTVAQEIQAYDDTNYPGIPPANPGAAPVEPVDMAAGACKTAVAASSNPVAIPLDSTTNFLVGAKVTIDTLESGIQELQTIVAVDGNSITVANLASAHDGSTAPFPLVQAGENGVIIAEWNEYTPTSGTDIAVTSNLATIA
jgi:hypothetical protein